MLQNKYGLIAYYLPLNSTLSQHILFRISSDTHEIILTENILRWDNGAVRYRNEHLLLLFFKLVIDFVLTFHCRIGNKK